MVTAKESPSPRSSGGCFDKAAAAMESRAAYVFATTGGT